jgi:TPR repeat protein
MNKILIFTTFIIFSEIACQAELIFKKTYEERVYKIDDLNYERKEYAYPDEEDRWVLDDRYMRKDIDEFKKSCLTNHVLRNCAQVGEWYYFSSKDGIDDQQDTENFMFFSKLGCDKSKKNDPSYSSQECNRYDTIIYQAEREAARKKEQEDFEVLKNNCEDGDGEACGQVSSIFYTVDNQTLEYKYGKSNKSFFELSKDYALKGYKKGNLLSTFTLASIRLKEKDYKDALSLYENLCNKNNKESCYFVYTLYSVPRDGIITNTPRAVKALKKSCSLGYETACSEIQWAKILKPIFK